MNREEKALFTLERNQYSSKEIKKYQCKKKEVE